MSKPEEIFIGMIAELAVMIIAIIILSLIFNKYKEKHHRYTLLLFFIFCCFLGTIFFTWLSKILILFGGYDYIPATEPDPLTVESFFILRIIDYRFSFTAFVGGGALTYILRVNLFDDDYGRTEKIFISTYGVCTIIFEIFIYLKANNTLSLIGYLLLLFYIIIIYVPFTSRCIKSYRGTEEKVYKRGFLSLTVMSLAVCSILIFNMLDVVYILLYDISYTIFYYISLASMIIGYLGAYFGYVKQRTAN